MPTEAQGKDGKNQKPQTNMSSLVAMLLLVVLGIGAFAIFQTGLTQLDRDVNRAGENLLSSGSVKGAALVEDVASLSISGDGIDRSYTFDLAGRTTAYDLLSRASLRDAFPIQTKQFDFGVFIEGIDNLKGDSTRFWAFYVNGQQAQVGADSYVVQPGDRIEFRLESIQ